MKILRLIEFGEHNSNGDQMIEFGAQDDKEISICFSGKDNDKLFQCDLTLSKSDCKEIIKFIGDHIQESINE